MEPFGPWLWVGARSPAKPIGHMHAAMGRVGTANFLSGFLSPLVARPWPAVLVGHLLKTGCDEARCGPPTASGFRSDPDHCARTWKRSRRAGDACHWVRFSVAPTMSPSIGAFFHYTTPVSIHIRPPTCWVKVKAPPAPSTRGVAVDPAIERVASILLDVFYFIFQARGEYI